MDREVILTGQLKRHRCSSRRRTIRAGQRTGSGVKCESPYSTFNVNLSVAAGRLALVGQPQEAPRASYPQEDLLSRVTKVAVTSLGRGGR